MDPDLSHHYRPTKPIVAIIGSLLMPQPPTTITFVGLLCGFGSCTNVTVCDRELLQHRQDI